MGLRGDVLALADELDGVSIKDNCEACLASGTELCRGDLECAESAHKACAKRLRAIAEKDADDVTTVSAHGLLPEEDRKAIEWVREHGGLESVKRRLDWVVGHCSTEQQLDFDFWLSGRVMHELGFEEDVADRNEVERRLIARLMPDGYEWPMVDGKPVDFRTHYEPSLGVLEAVSIYSTGACEVMSHDGIIKNVKEIHIVKPKVLDADGAEIRVGDTVWTTRDLDKFTVTDPNNGKFLSVSCKGEDGEDYCCYPTDLTHRAPVLAADGKPLREGERVWNMEIRQFGTVEEIFESELCGKLVRFAYDGGGHGAYEASKLTHEQPDDWSRWREDLELSPVEYADRYRVGRFGHEELDTYRDLVRRARKLAEKEQR